MKKIIHTIAVLFALIATPIQASSEDIMLDMIDYIEERSSYEYSGEKLPYIQIRTVEELCAKAFTPEQLENMQECNIAGLYDRNLQTIYVADKPPRYFVEDGFYETILIHELVHYLQDINGTYEEVACKAQLERDAYSIMHQYIDDNGISEDQKVDPIFVLLVSSCPGSPHF